MMEFESNDLIYFVANLFRIYVIYLFMDTFLEKEGVNRKLEFLLYTLYFGMNTVVRLYLNMPVLCILTNVFGLFFISLLYQSTVKKKILSILVITIIGICIETMFAIVIAKCSITFINEMEYGGIWFQITTLLLSFLVVLLLRGFQNWKKNLLVPGLYFAVVVTVPVASIILLLMMLHAGGMNRSSLVSSTIILLTINISFFEFYVETVRSMKNQIAKEYYEQQNKYYEMQLNMMKESNRQIRSIRHDLENHLYALRVYTKNKSWDELVTYINKMGNEVEKAQNLVRTGNVLLDSILTFKFQEAARMNIKLIKDIHVPDNLKCDNYDTTILLGNLLDNAITAAGRDEVENKWIEFTMTKSSGLIKIVIRNSYNGMIKKKDGKQELVKVFDKKYYGIGLTNVKKVVDKHKGVVMYRTENNVFTVVLSLSCFA